MRASAGSYYKMTTSTTKYLQIVFSGKPGTG